MKTLRKDLVGEVEPLKTPNWFEGGEVDLSTSEHR